MDLLEKAKSNNSCGLRKKFPWSGLEMKEPWTVEVTSLMEKSFVRTHLGSKFDVFKLIKRVENPYLWARYVLRHEELNASDCPHVKEHIVIHATTKECALRIADVNFDWRLVNRYRFGKGVSFSGDVEYATKYASGNSVYIIAGILIGNTMYGSYQTTIPPVNYDTTLGNRGKVHVKYYDDDFYPYYIVGTSEWNW